jgi:hypothetical protein
LLLLLLLLLLLPEVPLLVARVMALSSTVSGALVLLLLTTFFLKTRAVRVRAVHHSPLPPTDEMGQVAVPSLATDKFPLLPSLCSSSTTQVIFDELLTPC